MTFQFSPALDAELAYRREVLMAAARRSPSSTRIASRRGSWFRNRRRPS
jgi:hypothetical protein